MKTKVKKRGGKADHKGSLISLFGNASMSFYFDNNGIYFCKDGKPVACMTMEKPMPNIINAAGKPRLTEKHYNGDGYYMRCSAHRTCNGKCADCEKLDELVNRLGEYEDKAEQRTQVCNRNN